MAHLYMASAALLSAVFFWIAFRPRARFPLLVQTLFTAHCSVIAVLIVAGAPEVRGERWFAMLPAMGFWVMKDDLPYSVGVTWLVHAVCALGFYASLLLLWSRKYWKEYSRTCSALAQRAVPPSSES